MCTPKACLVLSQMRFRHLSFFSSATSSFTLFVDVTLSRFEVQAPLLSLLSPFLASLLAQAGPSPIVSVPFPEHLLRFHLTSFNLSEKAPLFHFLTFNFNSPLSPGDCLVLSPREGVCPQKKWTWPPLLDFWESRVSR